MGTVFSPKGSLTHLNTSEIIIGTAGILTLVYTFRLHLPSTPNLTKEKDSRRPLKEVLLNMAKPVIKISTKHCWTDTPRQVTLKGHYVSDPKNRLALQHKNFFFTVPMDHHPMTIVPGKCIDEIKALPKSITSLQKQVTTRFLGRYTGLSVTDTLVHSVKYDLTRNIPNILPELKGSIDYDSQGFATCR
ncbi:hypothetical protein K504DRAFT_498140 [Pleomassaria siparia CBS 279.74]|uniref:Uncharacterized protein n=1 Tax=Pleomassaria siparia CBS 279.74 TaxID=1314801 RepID=A0A6G1KLA3_9PLEO|nr:hypothetical protein K504DRAFT_498140 [Pleomassaria siparia CBS 279.74]